jgi:hypothetical protein
MLKFMMSGKADGTPPYVRIILSQTFLLYFCPAQYRKTVTAQSMPALMMTVTALVTGIINVCFISVPERGAGGIVFMMIFLTAYTSLEKNKKAPQR